MTCMFCKIGIIEHSNEFDVDYCPICNKIMKSSFNDLKNEIQLEN